MRTPAMNERSARVTIEKNMKDKDYEQVYMDILTIDEENAKRKSVVEKREEIDNISNIQW